MNLLCIFLGHLKVKSPGGQQSEWVLWPGEATPGPRGAETTPESLFGSIPLLIRGAWSVPGRRRGFRAHVLPWCSHRGLGNGGVGSLRDPAVSVSITQLTVPFPEGCWKQLKTSCTWQLNYPNAQCRNEAELGWICQVLALALDKCQCFCCRFGRRFTPNTHGWTQSPGQGWTGEDATELALFTWLRVDHFLLGMFL